MDKEKAEVLNNLFASVFNGNSSIHSPSADGSKVRTLACIVVISSCWQQHRRELALCLMTALHDLLNSESGLMKRFRPLPHSPFWITISYTSF